MTVIEKALGREAALILPPSLRTRRLDARLPQYQLGALQVLAEDGGESVDAMLMRMVEELIDRYRERLARVIPDLAEATARSTIQHLRGDCRERGHDLGATQRCCALKAAPLPSPLPELALSAIG